MMLPSRLGMSIVPDGALIVDEHGRQTTFLRRGQCIMIFHSKRSPSPCLGVSGMQYFLRKLTSEFHSLLTNN
eukprot:scaffold3136_cov102-Cylindrotheca_fusiformis.AAC.4